MLIKSIRARSPEALHLSEEQYLEAIRWLTYLRERQQAIPSEEDFNGPLGGEKKISVSLRGITIVLCTKTSGSNLSGFESTHDLDVNFSTIESELHIELILSFFTRIGISSFEVSFVDSKLWREFANSTGRSLNKPYFTASEITRLLDAYNIIVQASRTYIQSAEKVLCNIKALKPTPELIALFAKAALL